MDDLRLAVSVQGIPGAALRSECRRTDSLRCSLDLTHRCNLRCVHCYLGSHDGEKGDRELSTEQVFRLLRDAAGEGCLFLVISGGEPLLRPDFEDIYRYARGLGIWVTVFTNGTLVRDSHCELFSEFPPRLVEISLYGATAETYERVTRVPGSYGKCLRGIERLCSSGVRVSLKTMVLKSNIHEVSAMGDMARRFGLSFRMDPHVMCRLDGGTEPHAERVEPAAAVAREFEREETAARLRSHYLKARSGLGRATIYRCEAGIIGLQLDPDGTMRPCVIATDPCASPLEVGFRKAWEQIVEGFPLVSASSEAYCGKCENKFLCSCCPGIFSLEAGSVGEPLFMCEIAAQRLQRVSRELYRGG